MAWQRLRWGLETRRLAQMFRPPVRQMCVLRATTSHTHWGGHCCAAMNSKQAFLTRDASLGSLCYLVYEVRWLSSQLQDLIILLLHIDDQSAASVSKAPIYPSTQ
jgi:hypothetical protein